MPSVSVSFIDSLSRRQSLSVTTTPETEVGELIRLLIQDSGSTTNDQESQHLISSGYFVLCNGRRLDTASSVEDGKVYHIIPRVLGGKGGFGSMLRAIGAQIEKTTSREACRDLSGRRMRDINNEKKLKEWLAKEAEREKEQEQKRAERLAKHLNPPQHKFEDKQYQEQKEKVQEDLEDALQIGLKRALKKPKTKTEPGPSKAKKAKVEWLGVELDSDEDASDLEADPGQDSNSVKPVSNSDGECSSQSSNSAQERSSSPSVKAEVLQDSSHLPEKEVSLAQSSPSEDNVKTEPVEETDNKDTALIIEKNKDDVKPPSDLLASLPPPMKSETNNVKEETKDSCHSSEVSSGPINLKDFTSEAALCELGLERLKAELMSRGLKCGGTLEERANRLFSVRGLHPDDYPASLIAKAKGKGKKSK